RAPALALHGGDARLRFRDRTGQGPPPEEAVSGRNRVIRQRPFIISPQYAGTLPWSAIPDHDHPGPRGGGAPAAHRAAARAACAGRDWLLHGGAAGVSVGG